VDPDAGTPAEILTKWREAERRLDGLEAGSSEWHRTRREVEEYAAAYQEGVAEREDAAQDLGSSPGNGAAAMAARAGTEVG
jgi:hypothetical protein